MDFVASVMESVKSGTKGTLIDFSGAQTLVNAVRSLTELNTDSVENISKLAQRCTEEYGKLADDPNLAALGPSQLDVSQAIKAGLAARETKHPVQNMAGVSKEAFGVSAQEKGKGKGDKSEEPENIDG